MTAPTFWASCIICPFAYDPDQPGRYVDHLEAHVRAYRDEVKVTGMRQRDLEFARRAATRRAYDVTRRLGDS